MTRIGIRRADNDSNLPSVDFAETVSSVTDLSGTRELTGILSAREGLSKPAALCLAGSRLVIANAGDSTALLMDTATRALITVPLVSAPTQCQSLNARDLLAMNEAGDRPVALLQADDAVSYFVPADAP